MKVVDWYKWTRFKKRLVGVCFLIAFLCVFSMENGGDVYGYWGVFFSFIGALTLSTIDRDYW